VPAGIDIAGYGGDRILKKKTSDSWIALSVIGCSVVLFVALAIGLTGRFLVPGGHHVRVRFHDITGIKVSSQVKYAGARAGAVSSVRILSEAERSADPENLVEITLDLLPDVPPISKNATVSIAADTLLSDKFVLVQDDPDTAPRLGENDALQGISPTTFDKLTRNVDDAIEGVRKVMGGGTADSANDILTRIHKLVDETQALLTGLQPVVADAKTVLADAKVALTDARSAAADARSLLADNKDRIGHTISRLDSAAGSIESVAKKGEALLRDNEKNLTRSISDFRVTSENLKVTTTYSKFLLRDLAERPSRLIWGGGKPPALPDQQKILDSRQPLPMR
jgi:ABC-type transporter Mla subunit MlaD